MQNYKIEGKFPANHEYELKVLSSLLTIPEAHIMIFDLITIDSFDNSFHKHMFLNIKDLYKKNIPLEFEILLSELQKQPEALANCGGVKYLFNLAVFGTSNYDHYVGELLNLQQLRQVTFLLQQALISCGDETISSYELLNDINKNLLNLITPKTIEVEKPKDILDNFYAGMTFEQYLEWKKENKFLGIPSGFNKIDQTLGGFQNGKLYYCGARTSMGKTTFMLNLINNMLMPCDDILPRIGVFSLEMNASDIFIRLACIRSEISFKKFDSNSLSLKEENNLNEVIKELKNLNDNLMIEAPSSISVERLCMRARRLKEFYRIDILFIDYLSRIQSERKFPSRHLEIDYISKSLQNLARELNIPIFALAQLNREVAKKDDPIPSLTDFRESGSIEEDADACLLLHRPDYYDPSAEKGVIQVKIAKNRLLGTIGTIDLYANILKSDRYTDQMPVIPYPRAWHDS